MRITRFYNETWRFTVNVAVGGSHEMAVRWAERKLGDVVGGIRSSYVYGRTWTDRDTGDAAIWFREEPGTGTAAHEALHVIANALFIRGVGPMTPDNDEPYCYTHQWLVTQIGLWLYP